MSDPADIIIANIDKSATETIRVTLAHFKGRVGVDLRVFAVYRGTGQTGPTKSGFRIRTELVQPVIDALQKARVELGANRAANDG